MNILYEDNHLLIVNKPTGTLVQGDKTGDVPLVDEAKAYLKETYAKPGNVYCGVVHRIDRPASGLVILAKTSKALTRLNEMLREGKIRKTYLAIIEGKRQASNEHLCHWLTSDSRTNKTHVARHGTKESRRAELICRTLGEGERYSLVEVELLTGRKHQIRCQLSATGTPIKGDLKYGAKRSNPDGGISLLAYRLRFIHPVSKQYIDVKAPLPEHSLWHLGNPDEEWPEADTAIASFSKQTLGQKESC